MKKPDLTPEHLQQKIDHYTAVSTAHKELSEERPEKREHHTAMMQFYHGKSDAYTDLYNNLYPEMEKERAYPYNELQQRETIDLVKHIYAQKKDKTNPCGAETPERTAAPDSQRNDE